MLRFFSQSRVGHWHLPSALKMTQTKAQTLLSESNLFRPIQVGDITLQNRVVFAPLSRYRATPDNIPTDLILEHYAERAKDNGGLLIVEQTMVSNRTGHREFSPYFTSRDMAYKYWKPIVDAVHENDSFLAIQISALGRACNAQVTKDRGYPLRAPSKVYIDDKYEQQAIDAGIELQEYTIEELDLIKQDFVDAAKTAMEIGVDMLELHMANGYLFDQFLRDTSNFRTDKYGGSIENRARWPLEVIDAIGEAIGFSKVAVRISPYGTFQITSGVESRTHPIAQYGYFLAQLQKRADQEKKIAYVSFIEPVVDGTVDSTDEEVRNLNPHWMEEIWKGIILRAGNYIHEPERLVENVNLNDRTLIGIGRYFTSNPDLPHRLKYGYELTPYDRPTFYTHTNVGYNTFGRFGEDEIDRESEYAKRVPKPIGE